MPRRWKAAQSYSVRKAHVSSRLVALGVASAPVARGWASSEPRCSVTVHGNEIPVKVVSSARFVSESPKTCGACERAAAREASGRARQTRVCRRARSNLDRAEIGARLAHADEDEVGETARVLSRASARRPPVAHLLVREPELERARAHIRLEVLEEVLQAHRRRVHLDELPGEGVGEDDDVPDDPVRTARARVRVIESPRVARARAASKLRLTCRGRPPRCDTCA